MLCFGLFLLFAAAIAALILLLGGSAGLAVLGFVLGFVLAHVLFIVTAWAVTRRTDLSRPGAKADPFAVPAAAQLGELLCFYGGARPVIRGEEKLPKERFLFVCNHRSFFDPLLVMSKQREWQVAFISKPSNMRIPLAGPAAATIGYLAIDRENDRAALRTILTAADYMKRDICSIGIYPEGTRSRDGRLGPFHSGSFKAAQRANAPLVIACVRGTEKLKQGYFLRPHTVYLDILDLVPAERVKAMSTQELAAYSRERIRACLEGEGESA